jgi:hypothetical protein
LPVRNVSVSIRERSWLAKETRFEALDSKSKSKPSMAEEPKGRLVEELVWGPKVAQMLLAALIADVESGKPPSV